MTERSATLQQTYYLAAFSVPILVFYAAAQTAVALLVAPANASLKLVLEPYLLILGLILHVQWRRVGGVFHSEGLPRPLWIVAADALSFVITFWALGVLATAFLQEAKLM
jgi:hypothetical protein